MSATSVKLRSLLTQYIQLNALKKEAQSKDANPVLSQILKVMEADHHSLQDLLENLENELTGKKDETRGTATLLITECLTEQSFLTLSSQELHLFIIFFCRRLQDFPSCYASLQGILALLTKYSRLLDPKLLDFIDIWQSLTRDIHIPSYGQAIRYKAFEIFDYLLSTEVSSNKDSIKDSIIKKMLLQEDNLTEYVIGVIYALEGEKDPRCLLLDLKVMKTLCVTFPNVFDELYHPFQGKTSYSSNVLSKMDIDDMSHYHSKGDHDDHSETEDEKMTISQYLFDNISCYFPISFIPPPDDPYKITPELLSDALFNALFAIPSLTSLTIPFLLEQLINNDSEKARIEALQYLINIVQSRGYSVFLLPDNTSKKEEKGKGCCGGNHDDDAVSFYRAPDDISDDHAHSHHSHGSSNHVITQNQKRQKCNHDHGSGGGCGHDHDHGHSHAYDEHTSVIFSDLSTLEKLSHLIYDIIITEGSSIILDKANELMSTITYSLSKAMNTTTSAADNKKTGEVMEEEKLKVYWKLFVGNLLTKAKKELFPETIPTVLTGENHALDSLKGRNAWKLCLSLGQSGGLFANTAVMSSFLPTILPLVQSTLTKAKKELTNDIIYSYQGIRVLMTSSNSTNRHDEKLLPLVIAILENLVTLALPDVMDVSQFQSLSFFLQEKYHEIVFTELSQFILSPLVVDVGHVLKIKEEKDNVDQVKRVLENDILLCYLFVIRGIKELLRRLKGKELSSEVVFALLSRLYDIYEGGMNVLVQVNSSSSPYLLSDYFNLEKEDDALRKEIFDLFVVIGKYDAYTSLLTPQFLLRLISLLTSSNNHDTTSSLKKKRGLALLSAMIQKNESILLLQSLFQHFTSTIFQQSSSASTTSSEVEVGVLEEVLHLFAAIMKRDRSTSTGATTSMKKKADCFISLQSVKKTTSEQEKRHLIQESILLAIVRKVIPLHSGSALESSVLTLLEDCFYHYSTEVQTEVFEAILGCVRGQEPSEEVTERCIYHLLLFLDKGSAVLRPSVTSVFNASEYLKSLLRHFQGDCARKDHYLVLTHSIAILVNKMEVTSVFEEVLSEVAGMYLHLMMGVRGAERCFEEVRLFVWVLKALLLRSSPATSSLQKTLFDSFKHSLTSNNQGSDVIHRFFSTTEGVQLMKILLHNSTTTSEGDDFIDVLTKESRGNYSIFWLQKLYTSLLPLFNDVFTTRPVNTPITDNDVALLTSFINKLPVYLLFCQTIQQIPSTIRQSNAQLLFDNFLLLLSELHVIDQMKAVEVVEEVVKKAGLYEVEKEVFPAMEILLKENPLPFYQSLHIIIPRLIKVAQSGKEAKIRAMSLEGLHTLPQYISQYSTLHPYRKTVVNGLVKVLDDPKRAVRQLAVKVRNSWILMKEPSS